MVVLKANSELKKTFEKVIQTMGARVAWNGLFVVMDNFVILQGEVRSLLFHFDSRKAAETIVELDIRQEDIYDTAEYAQVRDIVNMVLYAFGKWGKIKGLRVEKGYPQINQMFGGVLREIQVDPDYTAESFHFYKNSIRITYEDVIEEALTAKEKMPEEKTETETQGLWHKVEWEMQRMSFGMKELTVEERRSSRIGNNFYRNGYLCPKCGRNLHMTVYPPGKEFRIATPEGAVLLARACTCDACTCFYTPRPAKMLSEGDVYMLDFEGDQSAYDDYLELIGARGDQRADYRYNEYAHKRRQKKAMADIKKTAGQQELEKACRDLSGCSKQELAELQGKIEEGFFPEQTVLKYEKALRAEWEKRRKKERSSGGSRDTDAENVSFSDEKKNGTEKTEAFSGSKQKSGEKNMFGAVRDSKSQKAHRKNENESEHILQEERNAEASTEKIVLAQEKQEAVLERNRAAEGSAENNEALEKIRAKYQAKMNVSGRMSVRQLQELKRQLERETQLPQEERQQYLEELRQRENEQQFASLAEKAENCKDKTYAVIKRVYDEVNEASLPESMKAELTVRLRENMQQQAQQEVSQLMEQMPQNLNRTRYQAFVDKLKSYEGVDLSPWQAQLAAQKEQAERREIAQQVRAARKTDRTELAELGKRLREQNFSEQAVRPYLEKIEERIRQMDSDKIAELVKDAASMPFEQAEKIYRELEKGEFLPDLKEDALERLGRRLSKIKAEESELLVKKLSEELKQAGIEENARHHFYPAKKVLQKEAEPEEIEVINYALASYAAGCGRFEYPIFVADTSRGKTGRDGMILTPEHLYYSTLLTAGGIPIESVEQITASTGLLNRGIYAKKKDGTKYKLPYAVETKEMSAYAGVLNEFIQYLKEKPDSRKVAYLAQEVHETICCFRCGCTYKTGSVCPKCGYKNNV